MVMLSIRKVCMLNTKAFKIKIKRELKDYNVKFIKFTKKHRITNNFLLESKLLFKHRVW